MYKYSYTCNMVECTTGQWECINRTEAEAPHNNMYLHVYLDLTASTSLCIKFITTTKTKLVSTKSIEQKAKMFSLIT